MTAGDPEGALRERASGTGPMHAVVASGDGSALRLTELARPQLPAGDWVRVAVRYGGVCGSDLRHLGAPPGRTDGGSGALRGPLDHADVGAASVDLASLSSASFTIPGHEVVGTVTEAGSRAGIRPGLRVVVRPVFSCAARGLPPCLHCAQGREPQCLRQSSGIVVHGKAIGFASACGGWSEEVVVHAGMVHPAPAALDDRTAVLAEPLSVVLSGLLNAPAGVETAAVIGGGTIGLLAVFALHRLLAPRHLATFVRHAHQAALARSLGACPALVADERAAIEASAGLLGSTMLGAGERAMLWDGFDLVVDAAGTARSLELALRLGNLGGCLLLLGTPGRVTVDLRPLWLKELRLIGALEQRGAVPGGERPMDRALALLEEAPQLGALVTHVFPLHRFGEALEVARNRAKHRSVKVLLAPGMQP